jgi:hypothetical protein
MNLSGYLNPLLEPGASFAHGAWIDGHHSKADFSCAVTSDYNRPISHADIRTGYYRVLRGVMHITSAKGRGAKPITWTEWPYARRELTTPSVSVIAREEDKAEKEDACEA